MDRSEVKAVVDREIVALRDALGLNHWSITFSYDPIDSGQANWQMHGNVEIKPEYDKAYVRLNPESFDTPDEVFHTLRHELLHVVLSPYDVYRKVIAPMFEAEPIATKMAEAAWTQSIEQAVIHLERMYRGLNGKARPSKPAAGKVKRKA